MQQISLHHHDPISVSFVTHFTIFPHYTNIRDALGEDRPILFPAILIVFLYVPPFGCPVIICLLFLSLGVSIHSKPLQTTNHHLSHYGMVLEGLSS